MILSDISPTTKKIFISAAILLALLLASLLIYNLFIKQPSQEEPIKPSGALPSSPVDRPGGSGSQTNAPSGSSSPTSSSLAALKIKPVSREKANWPTLGESGKTVKYFSRSSGRLYEVGFDGENYQEIVTPTLTNIIKAIWSPDKEKIIGVFSENNIIKKYFFDYSTSQTAQYNSQISYLTWSPDSKKIA